MPEPVSTIPNLGPASEAAFARAGIHSADEIRAMGADDAYLALLRSGTPPHFIGYYVLVMGLQGRPWNDCQGDEKKALRARFDTLKAQAMGGTAATGLPREMEAALRALGVMPAPTAAPKQKAAPKGGP